MRVASVIVKRPALSLYVETRRCTNLLHDDHDNDGDSGTSRSGSSNLYW